MAGRGGDQDQDAVADRPYDEAISIDDEEEEDVETPESSEAGSPTSADQRSPQGLAKQKAPGQPAGKPAGDDDDADSESHESSSSDESGSSESSGEEEGGHKKGKSGQPAGAYNPDDFKGMDVSSDIQELFQYIQRYKPHTIELDASLKPFIPELIPSIGEVDAFLKMPRPDGAASGLGTVLLDEPTMNPSDPSILDLQLRSLSKNQDLQPMEVRSIENAEKNPKQIEDWFRRIDDLNRSKPAPTVQYSRRMPDIEQLMEIWPREFEEFLESTPLPDLSDLDMDLPNYIRVIASILDVPVHNQLTESLHVIFTLYSEFRMNHHFSKAEGTGQFGQADPYSFPAPVPTFTQPNQNVSESIAPSRRPSPVHDR